MNAQPAAPNVARAGGIMMFSLLLSRILGIARDSVMAAKFGIGAQTDAYTLAFQIPDLLFFLIAGGALSSAFIPVFSEYLHTDREDEAWRLFSTVATLMTIFIGAFVIVAWIFATPLVQVIAPGKSAELTPLIAGISRILLPAQIAFFLGGLMFGTLYARQRFVAPGLGPNVYNLGIIFGAVFLGNVFNPGIVGMAWGALIGAFIGNLLIPAIVMARLGSRFAPSIDLSHPGVRKVFKLMLPVVLGLSLPGVYGMIMRAFGTYYPNGINTALDLSNKLMQAPLGIFGQSLAIAVFPALAQFYAVGQMDRFRSQLVRTLCTVVYITLPLSALMLMLAPDIVVVLYRYGKASSANLPAVAASLQMFSLGVVAWCLHPVLMRGYFALQRSVAPIVLGTLATAIFVGACYALGPTGLSYRALPLASSISAIVLVVLLLSFLKRLQPDISYGALGRTFGRSALAAAAMSAVVLLAAQIFPQGMHGGDNLRSLVRLGLFGLGGAWVYYAVSRILKMPEAEYVDRALARLAWRGAPLPPGTMDPPQGE